MIKKMFFTHKNLSSVENIIDLLGMFVAGRWCILNCNLHDETLMVNKSMYYPG